MSADQLDGIKLDDVRNALNMRTLAGLDATRYVVEQPTAACIEQIDGRVSGSLVELRFDENEVIARRVLEGSVFPPG